MKSKYFSNLVEHLLPGSHNKYKYKKKYKCKPGSEPPPWLSQQPLPQEVSLVASARILAPSSSFDPAAPTRPLRAGVVPLITFQSLF